MSMLYCVLYVLHASSCMHVHVNVDNHPRCENHETKIEATSHVSRSLDGRALAWSTDFCRLVLHWRKSLRCGWTSSMIASATGLLLAMPNAVERFIKFFAKHGGFTWRPEGKHPALQLMRMKGVQDMMWKKHLSKSIIFSTAWLHVGGDRWNQNRQSICYVSPYRSPTLRF